MGIRNLRICFALILALIALPAFAQGELSLVDSTTASDKRHMAFISGGGSIICTDVYDAYSAANNKSGFDFMVGYDWIISKSGLGVGLLYDGFYSSRKLSGGYIPESTSTTIFTNIIAPQFVVDVLRPGSRWAFSFKAGLGLATVTDALKEYGKLTERHTRYGLGVTLLAGAEYRITRHIGITATLTNLTSFLGTFHDEKDGTDKIDGLSRISINIGLKYRF